MPPQAAGNLKLPADMFLLQKRVEAAQALANEYLRRAEQAEFRERAHQDHWAMEVDRLRQEVVALRGPGKKTDGLNTAGLLVILWGAV